MQSRSGRVSPVDWYRVFLAVAAFLEIVACLVLFTGLKSNYELFSFLRMVKEMDDPSANSVGGVGGTVVRGNNPQLSKQQLDLLAILQKNYQIIDPVHVKAVWKHKEKRGKNDVTVTDSSIECTFPFTIKTRKNDDFKLTDQPDYSFSFREGSWSNSGPLSDFCRRGRWVEVTWFAPTYLYFMGEIGPQTRGLRTIGRKNKHPLIVSELSPSALSSALLWSMFFSGGVLLFFVVTRFFPIRVPLRATLEKKPEAYFVFDPTGGPEYLGIFYLILYPVVFGLIAANVDLIHSFYTERLVALGILGYFVLVHSCRTVEYFYLASRQDRKVYRVSRGFFLFNRDLVSTLSEFSPYMKATRGSKGGVSYSIAIRAVGGETEITDRGNGEKYEEILSAFKKFKSEKAPKEATQG